MENPQTDNNDKKYYDNMYKIANNYYYKKYIDINKGLQPRLYGNTDMKIDYDKLEKTDLSDLMDEIIKVI